MAKVKNVIFGVLCEMQAVLIRRYVIEKFPKGVWGHVGWCRHVLEHSGVVSSSFSSSLSSAFYIVAKTKKNSFSAYCARCRPNSSGGM